MEIFILIGSILLIIISFLSLRTGKKIYKVSMPENIEKIFKEFCDMLLFNVNVSCNNVELKRFRKEAEIPLKDGNLDFYDFDYTFDVNKAVVDNRGILLNSREILARTGFRGEPMLLFFRSGTEIVEVDFVSRTEVMKIGFREFVYSKYSDDNRIMVDDEFKLSGTIELFIGQNAEVKDSLGDMEKVLTRKKESLGSKIIYTDTWQNSDTRLSCLIQLEKKKSWVYFIKTKDNGFKTPRNIGVGNNVQELKKAYSKELSFDRDFKGHGRCYGYMAKGKNKKYIGFFVEDNIIKEIWMGEFFEEPPFQPKIGIVDDDIEWIMCNNNEKFSEKYAREMYLGQHKMEIYNEKVFTSFFATVLKMFHIVDREMITDKTDEKIYGIKCYKSKGEEKRYFNIEIVMKREKLEHSVTGSSIWIVERYRIQEID